MQSRWHEGLQQIYFTRKEKLSTLHLKTIVTFVVFLSEILELGLIANIAFMCDYNTLFTALLMWTLLNPRGPEYTKKRQHKHRQMVFEIGDDE